MRLSLSNNKIGSAGIKLLTKANFSQLQLVGLSDCQFGTEGMKHLVKSNWPSLKELAIQNDQISLDGFTFIPSANWREAEKVSYGKQFEKVVICYFYFLQPNFSTEFYAGDYFNQKKSYLGAFEKEVKKRLK